MDAINDTLQDLGIVETKNLLYFVISQGYLRMQSLLVSIPFFSIYRQLKLAIKVYSLTV